jgi:hypothetical protein
MCLIIYKIIICLLGMYGYLLIHKFLMFQIVYN